MSMEEIAPSFDAKKIKNFNNFYCFLPERRYRQPDFLKFANERVKKIIEDIDKTAKDLGIDIEEVTREYGRGNAKVWEGIKLMQKTRDSDSLEAEKISREGEAMRDEAHKKLIPLFEVLVKLGYTPEELMA